MPLSLLRLMGECYSHRTYNKNVEGPTTRRASDPNPPASISVIWLLEVETLFCGYPIAGFVHEPALSSLSSPSMSIPVPLFAPDVPRIRGLTL